MLPAPQSRTSDDTSTAEKLIRTAVEGSLRVERSDADWDRFDTLVGTSWGSLDPSDLSFLRAWYTADLRVFEAAPQQGFVPMRAHFLRGWIAALDVFLTKPVVNGPS
jgi:hypothetical protein